MKIQQAIIDAMIADTRQALPNEGCGYLAAEAKTDRITAIYPMTNVDASPEHFSFDPAEQFKTVKAARAAKQTLVAVYHSHPETPARLSEEDLKLLNDPDMLYIIVSFKNATPDIAAFKINKASDKISVTSINLEVL